MIQDHEPGYNLALYHLFKWSVVSPLFYSYFRGRVYGVENVPKSGPLVVTSNHASYLDPPMISCAVERPVAYMAKEELFKIPSLLKPFASMGYPVKRKAVDRSAIRSALEYLENGWATGVFLSGTRTRDGRIPNPKPSAALVASKAQVPILPVCLWGTEAIFQGSSKPRSVPVTIRIGEPINPPQSGDREGLDAVTQQCAEVIESLHDLGR